jgi:cytochrome c oxidase cbb3-type subunit III
MAKVTDQSFEHDYDGIKEYDNPLPRWWVWLFVGCVVWAVAYVPYYHFGPGKLPAEAYTDDMAAWLAAHPPEPLPDEDALVAMAAGDPGLPSLGQSIFVSRCAVCHAVDGGGQVGPNLTDDHALHGGSRAAIVKTIYDGVPAKGMLAWKNQLRREEIYAVGLYVHGLRGTTPQHPKAPEGDPIVDAPTPVAAGQPAAAEGATAAKGAAP